MKKLARAMRSSKKTQRFHLNPLHGDHENYLHIGGKDFSFFKKKENMRIFRPKDH